MESSKKMPFNSKNGIQNKFYHWLGPWETLEANGGCGQVDHSHGCIVKGKTALTKPMTPFTRTRRGSSPSYRSITPQPAAKGRGRSGPRAVRAPGREHHRAILRGGRDILHGDDLIGIQLPHGGEAPKKRRRVSHAVKQ